MFIRLSAEKNVSWQIYIYNLFNGPFKRFAVTMQYFDIAQVLCSLVCTAIQNQLYQLYDSIEYTYILIAGETMGGKHLSTIFNKLVKLTYV